MGDRKKFESFSAWKGFLSVDTKHRATLLVLAKDSHMHRKTLESLLDILGFEAPTNEIPDEPLEFEGMLDSEKLQKIIEYDEMARDLYTRILEMADPELVSLLSGGGDPEFFYQTLRQLVKDEERHIAMVQKVSGHVTRIQ